MNRGYISIFYLYLYKNICVLILASVLKNLGLISLTDFLTKMMIMIVIIIIEILEV